MQTMWMQMVRCLTLLVRIFERVQEQVSFLNYEEILEKIDALNHEISSLQANVTENKSGIKKNSDDIDLLNRDIVNVTDGDGLLSYISSNLIKSGIWHWGSYINTQGAFVSANGMMYSDDIPISSKINDKISFTGYDNNSIPCVIFKDKNKSILGSLYPNSIFLSGHYPGFTLDLNKLTYKKDIAYVSFNTAQSWTNTYMLLYGSEYPSSYVEYFEPYYTIKSEELLTLLNKLYKIIDVVTFKPIQPKKGYYTQKISIGENANKENISGNIAIGLNALQDNSTNVTVDNDDSGLWNTAVGHRAMEKNQKGNHSSAFGFQALRHMINGIHNTAVGENAMHGQTVGDQNVAVGSRALQSASGGNNNTSIGHASAYWNDSQHPTGSNNTYVGCHSGQADGAGSDNVAIGYFSGGSNNISNTISIGVNTSATKDNEIVIGNKSHTSIKIAGKVINFNGDGTVTWE